MPAHFMRDRGDSCKKWTWIHPSGFYQRLSCTQDCGADGADPGCLSRGGGGGECGGGYTPDVKSHCRATSRQTTVRTCTVHRDVPFNLIPRRFVGKRVSLALRSRTFKGRGPVSFCLLSSYSPLRTSLLSAPGRYGSWTLHCLFFNAAGARKPKQCTNDTLPVCFPQNCLRERGSDYH